MSDVSQTECFVNYLMISNDRYYIYVSIDVQGLPGGKKGDMHLTLHAYRDESMMLLLMLDCAWH